MLLPLPLLNDKEGPAGARGRITSSSPDPSSTTRRGVRQQVHGGMCENLAEVAPSERESPAPDKWACRRIVGPFRRVVSRASCYAIAAWVALAGVAHAQARVPIVATTTDLKSLAEAVGGERVALWRSCHRTRMRRSISPSRTT